MRTNDDANLVQVSESDPDYPTILRDRKAVQQYPCFRAIGNPKLLTDRLLGLVCSKRCPGNAILRTYALAKALRDAQIPVIGGFHSPMEKECLDLLLHGTQPVVVCPARSLEAMKLPRAWRSHISAGRLLLISSFAARHRRRADRHQITPRRCR
jgi:predicted Rossmann fold nucleotide-binding protein DprA/Smf involved in DNA uptake